MDSWSRYPSWYGRNETRQGFRCGLTCL
jgi:hypothetical protein